MTAADMHDRCGSLPQSPGLGGARASRPPGSIGAAPASFPIVLCRGEGVPMARRCATRQITGMLALSTTRSRAKLTRRGHVYAAGAARKLRVVLDVTRRVRAGADALTLTIPQLTTRLPVRIR